MAQRTMFTHANKPLSLRLEEDRHVDDLREIIRNHYAFSPATTFDILSADDTVVTVKVGESYRIEVTNAPTEGLYNSILLFVI